MKRFPNAGAGCQMPCPPVARIAVLTDDDIGDTSLESVSITLPSEVNVARAWIVGAVTGLGGAGVKVSCHEPASGGGVGLWAARGSTPDRTAPKITNAITSLDFITLHS